jgi:predicted DsbA family dithiol-disulfide isomerase
MLLSRLFGGQSFDLQATMDRLHRTASELGLPFKGSDRICNTRFAQELGLWAESLNAGERFHNAVFKAFFVDGRNLADVPVLAELAESTGLPGDEAVEVLKTGKFSTAVDEDWEYSREMRITAVPTFILNQSRLVGAQTYEALQGLMDANGVKKR